jgi:vitamin B12 transporter
VGLEDPNATEFSQQFFNRVELEGSYFDARWKPTIGVSYSSIYRHDQDFPSLENPFPFTQDSYFNGRRMQADWKNLIGITDEIDFIGGIDFDRSLSLNADGRRAGSHVQAGYGQLAARSSTT